MAEADNENNKVAYDISKKALGLEKESDSESKKSSGTVVGRKHENVPNNLLRKFFGGNPSEVVKSIYNDVLLPAAKDMFVDTITSGIKRLVYGATIEDRKNSRRIGNPSYVNYSAVSSNSNRRVISNRTRATHDFDDIIIDTRVAAEEALGYLGDQIQNYGKVSVADLYEYLSIDPEYTDRSWGWVTLRGAHVEQVREGFLLDLPRPELIK